MNNSGFDHECTNGHGVYNAHHWMVGDDCPVLVHGKPCGGILVAVGAGSVAANRKADRSGNRKCQCQQLVSA